MQTSVGARAVFPPGRGPLEGSPGAMELGLAATPREASMGLAASPFHSEKVQNEVQLQRLRPLTLDEDGRRTGGLLDRRSGSENVRADLREEPRVARVEAREEGPENRTQVGLLEGDSQAQGQSGGEHLDALPLSGSAGGVATDDGASEPRPLTETNVSLALVAVEAGSGRPCPHDTRELVPVEAGSTNPLMGRLLEDNKILKQRLELLEMGSRRPALGDLGPLHSPVSFASEGLRGQTVQNRSVRTVSEALLGAGSELYG